MKRLRNTSPAPVIAMPIRQPEPKSRWQELMAKRTWWAGLVAVAIVAGVLFWLWQDQWVMTTGRVRVQQAQITSPLRGTISEIFVQEGSVVKKGQLLAKLDESEILARSKRESAVLHQAEDKKRFLTQVGLPPRAQANMVKAERDVRVSEAAYHRMEAEIQKATVRLEDAVSARARTQQLVLLQAKTHAQWEQSIQGERKAKANLSAVQAQLAESLAVWEGAQDLLTQTQDDYLYTQEQYAHDLALIDFDIERAQAELGIVESRRSLVEIRAPQDGVISWIPRHVGEVIDHNDTMIGVTNPNVVWVEAYIEGEDVVDIGIQQKAWVKIKGITDEYLTATVSLIYPVERTGAQDNRVGPQRVRSSDRLKDLTHTVKIEFQEPVPSTLTSEMIAWVWIDKR